MSILLTKPVRSVSVASCASLTPMIRKNKTSVSIPNGIAWESISIIPHGSLTIASKVENKITVYQVTLTFRTCQDFEPESKLAYKVELTNGQTRLIGADERPWPVGTFQDAHPSKPTDNQTREVTVTWTSAHFCPNIL